MMINDFLNFNQLWYLNVASWLITYAIHSTIIFLIISLLSRINFFKQRNIQIRLWQIALLTGVFTSIWQSCLGVESIFISYIEVPQTSSAVKINQMRPVSNPSVAQNSWLNLIAFGFSIAWALVAILLLGRFYLLRIFFFQSFVAKPLQNAEIEAIIANLTQNISLKNQIKILHSEQLYSPIAYSNNTIYLPSKAIERLDKTQLKSMLAHEIAHLARKDDFWLQVYFWVEIIFFFQPLNTLVRKKIQENTEEICDNWAIEATQNQQALARCLVEVADWIKESKTYRLFSGMAIKKSSLAKRIESILNNPAEKQFSINRWQIILGFGAILWVFSAFSPGIQLKNFKAPSPVTNFSADTLSTENKLPKEKESSEVELEKPYFKEDVMDKDSKSNRELNPKEKNEPIIKKGK
jgi:beta-lactamase regulating signal transducer with metallopeptidase domain